MTINDVWAVHLDFIGPGMPDPGSVNLHYRIYEDNGFPTRQQTADALAAVFTGAFEAEFLALLPTTFTFLGARVRGEGAIATIGSDAPRSEAGTLALAGAEVLPVYVARVVTKRTASIGRRYQGRMYLPPAGEVHYEGPNTWASAYTTVIQQWLDEIDVIDPAATGNKARMCVYSKTYSIATDITTFIIRSKPGKVSSRIN